MLTKFFRRGIISHIRKGEIEMPNEENTILEDTVRIMDIIPVEAVKGSTTQDFDNFPLYEYVSDGVIRINEGRIKNQSDILFYDVTNASQDFKERFKDMITELDVHKVLKAEPKKEPCCSSIAKEIVSVIPLTGIYSSLNKSEIIALGNDFVTVTILENGIRIRPLIRAKRIPANLQLRLDLSNISPTLLEKISPDVVEFTEKENGLYEERKTVSDAKRFIIEKNEQ